MYSRFRPIARAIAANLLLSLVVNPFLLSTFAADKFSGTEIDRVVSRLDRVECETDASVIRKAAVGPGYDLSWYGAEVATPRGFAIRISKSNPSALVRGNNSITGFVFSDARRPIPSIYVELLNDVGASVSRTRTTVSGLFAFRGLGEGVFYVKVLPYNLNYVGEERRVPLISFSARPGFGSVSEQVDFYLKPKTVARAPFAAPGLVFAQEVPGKARQLYNEGIELIADKREDEAFERLKQAIEVFPRYFDALDRLGNEYVLRGYNRPAMLLLDRATEVNPKSFSSFFGLGLTQFRLLQLEQAINSFNRSVELYRDSVQANLWYGISLHAQGRHSEAEKALSAANRLSKGESPEVHWQLARVYKDQGRFEEAAAELELLLKLKPDAPNADEIKKTIVLLKQKSKPVS